MIRFSLLALVVSLFSTMSFATEREAILGVTYNADGITYQVSSGGCTSKENFEVAQLETFPVQLVLNRISPDFCEAYLPYGVTITFTYAELGLTEGTQFVIGNQISRGFVTIR